MHHLETAGRALDTRRHRRIAIRQDRVHRRVGHPGITVDDAVAHLVADDLASTVDLHQARLDQPVDVRIEAAESCRKLRREHVHGALGEIHRRPTLVPFFVQSTALLDVVRHVSDVDPEPVMPVRQLLQCDGIVEVARVLAVDRDRRDGRKSVRPRCRADDDRPEAPRLLDDLPNGLQGCVLRMMICVSTPGSLMLASTSTTWPTAPRVGSASG